MHLESRPPTVRRATVRTLALSPLALTESALTEAYSSGVLLMTAPPERRKGAPQSAAMAGDGTHLDTATPASDTGSHALAALLTITRNHLHGVRPPSASIEAFKEAVIIPLVKGDRNAFPEMITVGRTSNNDIVIESTMVSRFLGYFTQTRGGLRFYDSGSATNGTWVQGVRMEPRSWVDLEDGVELNFGADVKALFLRASGLYAMMTSCHLSPRHDP
jgi:hypothetical protein